MQIRFLLLLFFICCLSCNRKEKNNKEGSGTKSEMVFDKTKWRMKNGVDYPFRDKMLKDLVYNVKLKGIKKDEILDLLGGPDRVDSSYLFYRIIQKRIGFFPLHTKTLVIKLTKDSIVEWRKIHE